MTHWLSLPWTELTLVIPLIGAALVAFVRSRTAATSITLTVTILTLVTSVIPWIALVSGIERDPRFGASLFRVDGLSAPLLPLVALLHVLTVLATSRVKANRVSFTGHLLGEAVRLATFSCIDPWPLVLFLTLGPIPPYFELVRRKKPTGIYVVHMALFVALLIVGQAFVDWQVWGASALVLMAVLVRSGTVPAHLWVADLFEHATFGTALLFVTPITGVYAAMRLVLPVAPDWVLQSISLFSLVTAGYAAGMAVVQREARRFFAYLFLSHASLVLVGLELHTPISLTGALCLWFSVALSLGGLGLTLRALEARYGRLSLSSYSGLYDQSPALAVCFLLTGLGSVGFPGTLGFIAAELLTDGVVEANLFVGIVLVLTGAINGIAVIRAYLFLFTGTKHQSAVPLTITARERFAVLTLAGLILGGGLYPQPGVTDRHAAAEELLAKRAFERGDWWDWDTEE